MENNILILKEKLENIKKSGDIKLPPDKFCNIGLLFESILGITKNQLPVADIDGIELKVLKKNSKYPITLFNCSCDGPDFFELNSFVARYGAKDYIYNSTKILYIDLVSTNYINWGKNLKMKLHIDYNKKRIYIIVAHINGKIIEKRAFWNFFTLERILNQKISMLCLCSYVMLYHGNNRFCKLDNYVFMKNKGFDHFIHCLESGDIHISIKYGVYKKGKNKGLQYNHGTSFRIKKNTLPLLFEYF